MHRLSVFGLRAGLTFRLTDLQQVAFAGSKASPTGEKSAEIKKIVGVQTSENAPSFKGPEEVMNEASRDGKLKKAMETDGSIKQKTAVKSGSQSTRKFSTSTLAHTHGQGAGSTKSPKIKEEAGNITGQVVGHEGLESKTGAKPEQSNEWSKSNRKDSGDKRGHASGNDSAAPDRSHTKTVKDPY
ncbi:hypothetical protein RvY_11101 [Ramazzottius varieornatus]|uniref:Uncharacterized protein n=1 Tax=Ramazzottius varieornatus TaxID=947166 RepID=A0A1D1VNW9_RAMVA|nr:hypothetical protein RvY_11101 [Ramazzottius varieornatus]